MEIGAAYDKAMQEHIFDPLGMTQTTFSTQEALRGNHATPHEININDDIEIIEQTAGRGFNHTVMPYRPAGGAWSTPHDMIKYVKNELSEGVAADGTRLFAAAPLLKRREPFVATGKDSAYGMGLSTQKLSGITIVEHGGSIAGYRSQMAIIPGANTGAVILTNSGYGGLLLGPFTQRLVEILYDAESKPLEQVEAAVEFGRSRREKFRADLVIPPNPDVVSNLAAHYYSDELGPLDVRVEGNDVILDPGVWSSTVATKTNADDTISLVLTSPEFLGRVYVEFVIGKKNEQRILTLKDAQHSYVFTEMDK